MTYNMKSPEWKTAKRSRILVAGEEAERRRQLARVIDRERDMVCCGEAAGDANWAEAVASSAPDLVLLDLPFRDGTGLQRIRRLKARHPAIVILVLTGDDEAPFAERALRCGARGYITSGASRTELLKAMRTLLRGDFYVSRNVALLALHRLLATAPVALGDPVERLSDRELQVFRLLGGGRRTTEIASELHLSRKTVGTHRENIKRKLGLRNAVQLVSCAVRWSQEHRLSQ